MKRKMLDHLRRVRIHRYVMGILVLVLFVSVAVANAAAPQMDGDTMALMFQASTPYVTVQKDHTLHFNIAEARKSGLDKVAIDLIKEYIRLHNQSMKELAQGKATTGVDGEMFARFEPFFRRVATKGLGDIPAPANVTIAADACGGSQSNPHPCPPRLEVGLYWNSRDAVAQYLRNQGFHQTAGYASNYNGDDYSKVVSAYGCSGGPFRIQALIHQAPNGKWTFWTQQPEPNPEVLSYIWPAYWWADYVRWWHLNFC